MNSTLNSMILDAAIRTIRTDLRDEVALLARSAVAEHVNAVVDREMVAPVVAGRIAEMDIGERLDAALSGAASEYVRMEGAATREHLAEQLHVALAANGASPSDIAYYLLSHDGSSMRREIVDKFMERFMGDTTSPNVERILTRAESEATAKVVAELTRPSRLADMMDMVARLVADHFIVQMTVDATGSASEVPDGPADPIRDDASLPY
jgi:hypothetical protein